MRAIIIGAVVLFVLFAVALEIAAVLVNDEDEEVEFFNLDDGGD